MATISDFTTELEAKVAQQLKSQRVGYLLGAGSSYLNGYGYPLSFELWDLIKNHISDTIRRDEIQSKLDAGAKGIEHALDLLDDGGLLEGPHRYIVAAAIADQFLPLTPTLVHHVEFIKRLAAKLVPHVRIFNLNYDPLIERSAELARVRLCDGFVGHEHAYFDASTFSERVGQIRGTSKDKKFDEIVRPILLLKLHGSVGWYQCATNGVRRCGFGVCIPSGTKRLLIPPKNARQTIR